MTNRMKLGRVLFPTQIGQNLNQTALSLLDEALKKSINANSVNYFKVVKKSQINTLPILIGRDEMKALKRIQESIYFGIKNVVENYHQDTRIQSRFQFSNQVKAILDLYKNKSYAHIDTYRPDFLHEENTLAPKICEINARFPLNGYLVTYFGMQSMSSCLSTLKSLEIRSNDFSAVQELRGFGQILEKKFDTSKPIGILRKRELGIDVHMLKDLLPETKFYFLEPSQLFINHSNKRIEARLAEGESIVISQFILELHQDEILSMPFELISKIVDSCQLMNDLRTVFLVHDKCLLSILSQETSLLNEYLPASQLAVLKRHVILTRSTSELGADNQARSEIDEFKNDWLIKPRGRGKGEGIVFGKNVSYLKWKALLKNVCQTSEFIIQKYVKQHKFEFVSTRNGTSNNNWCSKSTNNMIGTILCWNDEFLGPGIYRASNKDLIALSRGGFIMYPFQEGEKNNETRFPPLNLSNESVFKIKSVSDFCAERRQSVANQLNGSGLVLLDLDFVDKESKFLLKLVQDLDMTPLAHSGKGNDFVWHIRPLFDKVSPERARSHTSEVFDMHTDSSYEKVPSRYFAMQAFRPDRFRGGKSLFIKLDDVLSNLTENDIDLLAHTKVRIKRPYEFFNGPEHECIEATILSPRCDSRGKRLVRYRNDILVNRELESAEFKNAVARFERLISIKTSELIKSIYLEKNQIILVDNSTWLHGRSMILDHERHLVRVRFQTRNKLLLPW